MDPGGPRVAAGSVHVSRVGLGPTGGRWPARAAGGRLTSRAHAFAWCVHNVLSPLYSRDVRAEAGWWQETLLCSGIGPKPCCNTQLKHVFSKPSRKLEVAKEVFTRSFLARDYIRNIPSFPERGSGCPVPTCGWLAGRGRETRALSALGGAWLVHGARQRRVTGHGLSY